METREVEDFRDAPIEERKGDRDRKGPTTSSRRIHGAGNLPKDLLVHEGKNSI